MKRHFNCTEMSYDNVRSTVESYLEHESGGSLSEGVSLLSLVELFDLAAIFIKEIAIDKALRKEIATIDPDNLRYRWIDNKMKIRGNEVGERLIKPIIRQVEQIVPQAKIMVTKFSIIILIQSKPVIRFENITHRRYRYVYGTIVVDNVSSKSELHSTLPKFLLDSDAKLGVRYAKVQGCVRNVTGSTFLRVVRHFKNELKIV